MKKNITTLTAFLFVFLLGNSSTFAQELDKSSAISVDSPLYEQLKAAGKLGGHTIVQPVGKNSVTQHVEYDANRGSGSTSIQSAADCDCWIPTDGTFNIVPFTNGIAPDYRNDDGSTSAIILPFNFCLNSTTQNTVYINNNGNISFGSPYGTFSAFPFPDPTYKMIAPFWADVDTRNPASGLVYYKITPTYMIVQWDNVGYYSQYVDKLNTFQLIISDGSDPIIPGGKNVSFCYKDMQWTTGDASGGGGTGFGGTPATVGVNFGDGVNYIQIGRFDQPGIAYDGPFGATDGVDWLDNQHFAFNWCNSTNIAPVLSNPNFCDTVTVCVGAVINPTLTFLAPEQTQTTTTSISSSLTNWVVLNNTPGNINNVSVQITAMPVDVGFQTITFSSTDDDPLDPQNTTFSILVHVLASPTVNAGPDTSFCTTPVQLNATGSAGVISYSWTPATGLDNPTISNPFASPASNTNYIVTVSNGTCTAQDTVSVIGGVTNANVSANATICQGSNTQLTAGGGSTYSWSPATGLSNSTISNPVASPSTTTTYTVTVSNGPGCFATATVDITVSPSIVPAISSFADVTCFGLNNGSATVNVAGGTGPYTYLWNDPAAQTTSTASGLAGGSYTVTVTDAAGCTQTTTASIFEPTALTAAQGPITDILCFGDANGSVNVNANGGTMGYTYLWNDPSAQTTATASGLSGGTYTVVVTDANGCTQTSSSTVIEPSAPLAANITGQVDILCNGNGNGSATVSATGGTIGPGYTYAWLPGGATTATATGLSGGLYTVTITDANGCIQTASTTILEPTPLIATQGPTTDILCFGDGNGSVSVNANGGTLGYTYLWNDPSAQTTATASGLSGGTYTVIVTDANGCTQTSSSTVNEPSAALVANIAGTTDVTCFGGNNGSATVNANGGTGLYNYAWSSGGINSLEQNLIAGDYSVVVTDANGCTSLANTTIYEPALVTLAVSSDTTICIGQNATIEAFGNGGIAPLSYLWSNTLTTSNQVVSPAVTTSYSVTVTDANGCSPAQQTVTVNVNPPLTVNASATPSICFGSTADISSTAGGGNGGPYSYSWNGGLIINPNATVTPDHDTTFVIEINDGCSPPVMTAVNIIVNPVPVAAFGPLTAEGCPALNVGFTDSSVTEAGSFYHWNFGDSFTSTSQNPSHVYTESGQYSVSLIVQSPAGCSDTLLMTDLVNVLPVPEAMFSSSEQQVSMYNPVVSFTNLSTGTNWQNWDFGDGIGSSDSLNPVYLYTAAGIYTVQLIVQNNVGCLDTINSIISVTNEITMYVPTGFTPNGDGLNDFFRGYGIGILEYSLSVFDRWGTQVFHSDNQDIPWNGFYNSKGEVCPNDVYVYKITYKDVDGVTHDKVGHVALTR
jgi:gliding motility-associated-like protein